MTPQSVRPATLSGTVLLPGDKSISHRYAMLAAIAEETSELKISRPAATVTALSHAFKPSEWKCRNAANRNHPAAACEA